MNKETSIGNATQIWIRENFMKRLPVLHWSAANARHWLRGTRVARGMLWPRSNAFLKARAIPRDPPRFGTTGRTCRVHRLADLVTRAEEDWSSAIVKLIQISDAHIRSIPADSSANSLVAVPPSFLTMTGSEIRSSCHNIFARSSRSTKLGF